MKIYCDKLWQATRSSAWERNNHPQKAAPRTPLRAVLASSDCKKWLLWKLGELEMLLEEMDGYERLAL